MKSSEFKVSVITPVCNAEKYVRKSVESANQLEEVGEIILVEDGSPDNSLKICKQLEQEYDKVKLYQHPDKQNHGAGASRNLGIKKARYDYIAFLDADDYYLPKRFKKDKDILISQLSIDGIYNAIGIHYYSEKAKEVFIDAGYEYQEFLTISSQIEPERLFMVLFHRHSSAQGEFHTNSVTVRKRVFDIAGIFNEKLKLQQDTHMWARLAAYCNLVGGEITSPVAIRGVHGKNRMLVKEDIEKCLDEWWGSLKNSFKEKKISPDKQAVFDEGFTNYQIKRSPKIKAVLILILYTIKHPIIIRQSYGFMDLNLIKIFGQNRLIIHFISFKNRLFSPKTK